MELPLFESHSKPENKPWAERLRPAQWDEFVGQDNVKKLILDLISRRSIPNLVLYGPPGSGKSTAARLLRQSLEGRWIEAHGADLNAAQMRAISSEAKQSLLIMDQKTYLLVDEVHRLSKSQQDHLLEPLELGTFTLVSTTTENPFSALNKAFLSRVRIVPFKLLTTEDLQTILARGYARLQPGTDPGTVLTIELQNELIRTADGDARRLLSDLQDLVSIYQIEQKTLDVADLLRIKGKAEQRSLSESEYYDILSAFIKSIRGSDPDAALLWLAHLIRGGVDPKMIARRLVISASEDIGNADPKGLGVAVNAAQAVDYVGLPEVGIVLAQATVYLACAPKSNSSYRGYGRALEFVDQKGISAVPTNLTVAGMSTYKSPHKMPQGFVEQEYSPVQEKFYEPVLRGYEKKMAEYMEWIRGKKPG